MTVEELFPMQKGCSQPDQGTAVDFASLTRHRILSYCSSTSKNISFRHIFENANLSAAMLDHDYFDRKYVEYWVDRANMVCKVAVVVCDFSNVAVFFSVFL